MTRAARQAVPAERFRFLIGILRFFLCELATARDVDEGCEPFDEVGTDFRSWRRRCLVRSRSNRAPGYVLEFPLRLFKIHPSSLAD